MPFSSSQSLQVAQALVDVGVVRVATSQPFIYTSGWASPIYLNTQALMSHVQCRTQVMDLAAEAMREHIASQGISAIVGAESSGIAFAAWLAERLHLPMLYLRKRPVGWGMGAQLEGRLPADARVLLVDDVTTDARSKVDACLALRKCGARVHDVLVLVNFDIYPRSSETLKQHDIALHSLVTWPRLFEVYVPQAPLSPVQRNALFEFNAEPVAWSLNHGGVGQ